MSMRLGSRVRELGGMHTTTYRWCMIKEEKERPTGKGNLDMRAFNILKNAFFKESSHARRATSLSHIVFLC